LFLFGDHFFDLAIFDRAERVSGDLITRALLARRFDRRRPQQAADMIGAKRRTGALGHLLSSSPACGAGGERSEPEGALARPLPPHRVVVNVLPSASLY